MESYEDIMDRMLDVWNGLTSIRDQDEHEGDAVLLQSMIADAADLIEKLERFAEGQLGE